MRKAMRRTAHIGASVTTLLLLTGCEWRLFDPKGPIASDIMWLLIVSAGVMLLVVVPVTVLGIIFPWRYRKGNTDQPYEPDWEHSTKIEIVVWTIPIIIILILGTITWYTSHSLDPRKPIESDKPTMVIQVVAMKWKWLFIYPEQEIATINEVAMPVNQPVQFLITSDSTMNSFFIPNLGSQIYAMSGMENRLHLMADEVGVYDGFSANYSGFGFSGMKFKTHVLPDEAAFTDWVQTVRNSDDTLDNPRYQELRKKSRDVPPAYFALGNPLLFSDIIDTYSGSLGQISKKRLQRGDSADAHAASSSETSTLQEGGH